MRLLPELALLPPDLGALARTMATLPGAVAVVLGGSRGAACSRRRVSTASASWLDDVARALAT